jgi:exonuclease SbcC
VLLRSLRLRGIGPFRNEVHLDLAGLPRVVAVVGPNGAGKSTLLGCFVAALERAFPGDDPFADGRPLSRLATARDSFLEAIVCAGADRAYRLRHLVDAVSGKSEAVVFDSELDGAPVLSTTKVTDFDRWRLEHLPPREVLLTSIFAAQGSGGFLDMTSGQRKGVILRTLGIERYEAIAERARVHKEAARAAAERLDGDAAREQKLAGGDASRAGDLKDAREAHAAVGDRLATARARLETLKSEHAAAAAAAREGEVARKRNADAVARLTSARIRARECAAKVKEQEAVLADRASIERAVRRVAELSTTIQELTALARGHEDAAKTADAETSTAEADQLRIRRTVEQPAKRRADEARRRLEDRKAVEEAALRLVGLRSALQEAQEELRAARAEVERVAGLKVAGAEERIVCLRIGHERVRDLEWEAAELKKIAASTLIDDDATVTAASEVPAQEVAARARRDAATSAEEKARGALWFTEQLAARDKEMAQAATDLAAAEEEARVAGEEASSAGTRRELAVARAATSRSAAAMLEKDRKVADQERQSIAVEAARADALAVAAARLEDLRPAAADADAEVAAAEEALRLAPAPGNVPAVPDLAQAERAVRDAEAALSASAGRVGAAEARLAEAKEAEARWQAALAARDEAQAEASDWNRLAEDWGRKGIQALEIDAAGPELTAIVNDLLRQAFGVRYTVSIETTRLREKDGEPIEVFDLRVIDLEHGYEGPVEALSGGQRTIVGEALRLALTTLASRRHGFREMTLVRDESGAALDQENGPAWVAMLRRAADLVGAKQVLFVTHDPALAELADARIRVKRDGTVKVE